MSYERNEPGRTYRYDSSLEGMFRLGEEERARTLLRAYLKGERIVGYEQPQIKQPQETAGNTKATQQPPEEIPVFNAEETVLRDRTAGEKLDLT